MPGRSPNSGRGEASLARSRPSRAAPSSRIFRKNPRVLNCQHHISWVRPVAGGLHQCILCQQIVSRKDVYPKLEDLTEELRRRWDAHEATRPPPEPPAPPPKPR